MEIQCVGHVAHLERALCGRRFYLRQCTRNRTLVQASACSYRHAVIRMQSKAGSKASACSQKQTSACSQKQALACSQKQASACSQKQASACSQKHTVKQSLQEAKTCSFASLLPEIDQNNFSHTLTSQDSFHPAAWCSSRSAQFRRRRAKILLQNVHARLRYQCHLHHKQSAKVRIRVCSSPIFSETKTFEVSAQKASSF